MPIDLDITCAILNWERHGGDVLWFPMAAGKDGHAVAMGMYRDAMEGPAPIPADEATRLAKEYQDAYRARTT